ncbi:MAG: outer membrane protein OmpA-like peptidoglycan-associated protein [Ulvibacter sp.]|jgi:outer membrane protein OmpA-like peptidoglycan-associated protein
MTTILKQFKIVILALTIVIGLGGCEATKNANNKQKGAVIGAAGGAILGAILGNNLGGGGNGELGAVIGGVVGGGAGVLIGNKMDKQAQKIEDEIPGAVVERVDDGIIITFDENSGVFFDSGKYNLNAASNANLDKLSGILVEFSDTNVLVVGHTDSQGSDSSNLLLSERRAKAVTAYFTTTKGLSSARFTTHWYGEQTPVGDNATTEGREKNRRVNIAIVPNEKMKEDAKKQSGGN